MYIYIYIYIYICMYVCIYMYAISFLKHVRASDPVLITAPQAHKKTHLITLFLVAQKKLSMWQRSSLHHIHTYVCIHTYIHTYIIYIQNIHIYICIYILFYKASSKEALYGKYTRALTFFRISVLPASADSIWCRDICFSTSFRQSVCVCVCVCVCARARSLHVYTLTHTYTNIHTHTHTHTHTHKCQHT
jgi:hypothetical protein